MPQCAVNLHVPPTLACTHAACLRFGVTVRGVFGCHGRLTLWALFVVLVRSRLPETFKTDIEKACKSIFPLQNVSVRKVKMLKSPKFDRTCTRAHWHSLGWGWGWGCMTFGAGCPIYPSSS